MTDLMDRLAAANPARDQDERPPIDDVWRKIAAEPAAAPRGARRRRSAALGRIAAAAIPVLAVVLVALPGHHVDRHRPQPAVTGHRRPHSTVDPVAQRSALHALGDRSGSVVVMNPKTGAIEAMASSGSLRGGAQRAVPPGGVFDVVTLATALSTGRYGPQSKVSGASPFGAADSQVRNDAGQSFGRVRLSDALAFSINTVFARVGMNVGAQALTRQMRLFELSSRPARGGRVAVGPLAAGQASITATPLQLAAVAAAVANGGRLAQPHATELARPVAVRTVMPSRTARLLTDMLRRVVTDGTGTPANLPGLKIAGKTGTAPFGARGTVATFIGFAPADHPTVAIAVVLELPRGGFGGTTAAPIAARVLHEVLRGPR
jgi:penicillin-binding protein A